MGARTDAATHQLKGLLDLPAETVSHVADELDTSTVGTFRLVNHKFSDVGVSVYKTRFISNSWDRSIVITPAAESYRALSVIAKSPMQEACDTITLRIDAPEEGIRTRPSDEQASGLLDDLKRFGNIRQVRIDVCAYRKANGGLIRELFPYKKPNAAASHGQVDECVDGAPHKDAWWFDSMAILCNAVADLVQSSPGKFKIRLDFHPMFEPPGEQLATTIKTILSSTTDVEIVEANDTETSLPMMMPAHFRVNVWTQNWRDIILSTPCMKSLVLRNASDSSTTWEHPPCATKIPVALFDGCKNGGWVGAPALQELTLLNLSLLGDDFVAACEVFGPQLRSFTASHTLLTVCDVWNTDEWGDSILRPYAYPFADGIFEGADTQFAYLRYFTNLERLRLEMCEKYVAIWAKDGAVLDDCARSVHSQRCRCSVSQCGSEDCWDIGRYYMNEVRKGSSSR